MRFQFDFARKSALWTRLVVQPFNEESSVVTLYYRVLRGEAGKSQDEACFRVRPSMYDYVDSHDHRHQKPIHQTEGFKTGDYLQHLQKYEREKASGKRDEDDIPEAFESMFLHHHIYLPVAMNAAEMPGFLQKILDDFRQIEKECSEKGQYPLGGYTFATPEETRDLLEQYFKCIKVQNKATEKTASPVLQFSSPKTVESMTPLAFIDNHIATQLGEQYKKQYGKNWVIKKIEEADEFEIIFNLPAYPALKWQEWFLKRFPNSSFQRGEDNKGIIVALLTAEDLKPENRELFMSLTRTSSAHPATLADLRI